MRLLAVRFENLNSLRGEHEVVLEHGPLAEAGLFAITGATGAGKSTILDAVTLALYGRAARYGTDTPSDMMSRGTAECSAAVDFECAGGRYTAVWRCWRSRGRADGTLQPVKHELSRDGIIIEDRTSGVVPRIEALTGLDYARFLRSVLLAQGQFAAFLKAPPKERADLLQRITGSEIYSALGRLAHETAREMADAVRAAEMGLGAIAVHSDEQRGEMQTAIATATAGLAERAARETVLEAETAAAERAAVLLGEETKLAAEEAALAAARGDFAHGESRLRQHAAAAPFAELLSATEHGEKLRRTAAALRSEYPGDDPAPPLPSVDATDALPLLAEKKSAAAAAAGHLREAEKLAAAAREAYTAAAQRVHSASASADTAAAHARTAAAAVTAAENAAHLAGPVEPREQQHAEAGEKSAALTRVRRAMEAAAILQKELTAQEDQSTLLHERRTAAATAAQQAAELLTSARRAESLLHELVRQEQVIRSLDDHRAHLAAGQPCPLCGATAHPWAAAVSQPPESAAARLREQQSRVAAAEKENHRAAAALSAAEKLAAAAVSRHDTLRDTLTRDRAAMDVAWRLHFSIACDAPALAAAEAETADALTAARTLLDTARTAAAHLSQSRHTAERAAAEAEHARALAADASAAATQRRTEAEQSAARATAAHTAAGDAATAARTAAAAVTLTAAAAEKALTHALTGSPFRTAAEVRAALLDHSALTTLTRRRDELAATAIRLDTRRSQLTAARAALPPPAAAADFPTLQQTLRDYKTATLELRDRRAALQQQLTADDAARTRRATAAAALDAARAAARPWARLSELIGSSDGSKFSRFAQSLTLDVLIAMAGQRLERLCDRYRLVRAGPQEDLALQIADAWQGDTRRPMESLSGGETFLISLALALALSELAGRRTRIATLFIDEGFGMLDSASLDTALSALESLRTAHSTIGIISHVESLKARLTTQVEVLRGPEGWSRLRQK